MVTHCSPLLTRTCVLGEADLDTGHIVLLSYIVFFYYSLLLSTPGRNEYNMTWLIAIDSGIALSRNNSV